MYLSNCITWNSQRNFGLTGLIGFQDPYRMNNNYIIIIIEIVKKLEQYKKSIVNDFFPSLHGQITAIYA